MLNHRPRGSSKRLVATIAALSGIALLAACSSSGSKAPSTSSSSSASAGGASSNAASGKSVALVSAQNTGDAGPVDSMNTALGELKSKYSASTKFIYAADPSSYQATLRQLGQAKTSVVVAPFPALQSAVNAVAPSFPNTKWIELYADPNNPEISNVRTVGFDQYKGFYLSGILAASVSKTGSIGYVGGQVQPGLNADFHAYEAGAKSINANIKVVGAFVGSFTDPTKAASIASSLISKGADVIQTDAAASSLGVVKAAKSGNATVITDLSSSIDSQYPDTIIGNSYLYFGDAMSKQVLDALASGWKGGAATAGFEDNTAGLAVSSAITPGSALATKVSGVASTLSKVKSQIVGGSLTVPFNTGNI